MGFFNKIRTAFGLSDDDADELITDDPEMAEQNVLPENTEIPSQPVGISTVSEVRIDEASETAIFEHVVSVFNQSLPDFLKSSVNPDAQRQYLFRTLSDDLKSYLSSLSSMTRRQYEQQWQNERARLQEKVRELEEKSRDIEQKREELNQQKLSAERQRRSLSDRVHDLEKQVINLEAEKEQFQLESKSMSNKLKVASVHEDDLTALQEEINRLNAEIKKYQAEKAAQLNADGNRQHEKELEDTLAELTETYKNSESMRKETAKKLETTENSLEKALKELSDTNSKNKEIEEKLAESNKKYEEIKSMVSDAEQMHSQMRQIEKQLTQFEEIKKKKDNRINELRAELEQSKSRVHDLEKSIAGTIELHNNGEEHYKAEIGRLTREIESLREKNNELSKISAQRSDLKPESERDSVIVTSERDEIIFDDIFSDTDWVIQQPSAPKNRKDNEKRHNRNDNRRNDPDLPSLF